MTGGRRDVHRRHDDQNRERQDRLDHHEAGKPTHRGAPDGRPVAAEAAEEHRAIQRGEGERQRQKRELGEQKSSVARADQPRHAANVDDREHGPRGGEQNDHDEGRA